MFYNKALRLYRPFGKILFSSPNFIVYFLSFFEDLYAFLSLRVAEGLFG